MRIPEVSIYNLSSYKRIRPTKSGAIKCLDYREKTIMPESKFKIIISKSILDTELCCYDGNCTFFPGGSCGLLTDNMFILPYGMVGACEQLYWLSDFIIGDVKSQSIRDIWTSQRAINIYDNVISLYQKSEICSKCTLLQKCANNKRKCWVKVLKGYNSFSINHPDPRCVFAPLPLENNLSY